MAEENKKGLRMEYIPTVLTDINFEDVRACPEVRSSGISLYVHKPYRNQGRFGSLRDLRLSDNLNFQISC
jgi:hypothetical protein